MAKFTQLQRKLMFGVGIFAMIAALVSLGITIGRGSSGGSIAVSMLLIIVGIVLILIPQISQKN